MANRDMLRRPDAPDYTTGHAIENNLAMAETLGLAPTTHELSLPHLRNASEKKSGHVLIHPGASRDVKRWPAGNWAALADAVVEKTSRSILLTGDASEQPLALAVKAAMKNSDHAEIAAGQLSLLELARKQATATAFVSGDTGPYHLALAAGCPTVTLFAPTDRGSSTEACGPHQAPPRFHRAIETARFGDSISTLSVDRIWPELKPLLEN
jgi:ADP-heptose:LPS heptosyltransferase